MRKLIHHGNVPHYKLLTTLKRQGPESSHRYAVPPPLGKEGFCPSFLFEMTIQTHGAVKTALHLFRSKQNED